MIPPLEIFHPPPKAENNEWSIIYLQWQRNLKIAFTSGVSMEIIYAEGWKDKTKTKTKQNKQTKEQQRHVYPERKKNVIGSKQKSRNMDDPERRLMKAEAHRLTVI